MDKEKFKRRDFIKNTAGVCGAALVLGALGPKGLFASENRKIPGAQKGLLKPKVSGWFRKSEDNKIECTLCPLRCRLSEGERGFCRVRENRAGRGYTLVYGNPALIQEDPIERKPFFHVLPGSRALSVSTAGCNLECKFCEVWDMALASPEEIYSYQMDPESVIKHAAASGVKSVSFAFGEPVVFYEYMVSTAKLAKRRGFLNLLHTAGYINPEPLKELIPHIDAVNVDLKSFSKDFYREVVSGELQPVLDTLKFLKKEGVHIEITNILIPTLNDDMDMISRMSSWIASELGSGVPLHFARFYPLFKLSALPRTPVSTLNEARKRAIREGLNYVYVSRVTGHEGENSFCSNCGKKIIARVGFWVDDVKIKNGKCYYCGNTSPGKWS